MREASQPLHICPQSPGGREKSGEVAGALPGGSAIEQDLEYSENVDEQTTRQQISHARKHEHSVLPIVYHLAEGVTTTAQSPNRPGGCRWHISPRVGLIAF